MKLGIVLSVPLLCFSPGINKAGVKKTLSYVDPFIGSGSHGHVFVGASVPFGAVQVGPNNFYKRWDWCSGYNYSDSMLIGFLLWNWIGKPYSKTYIIHNDKINGGVLTVTMGSLPNYNYGKRSDLVPI